MTQDKIKAALEILVSENPFRDGTPSYDIYQAERKVAGRIIETALSQPAASNAEALEIIGSLLNEILSAAKLGSYDGQIYERGQYFLLQSQAAQRKADAVEALEVCSTCKGRGKCDDGDWCDYQNSEWTCEECNGDGVHGGKTLVGKIYFYLRNKSMGHPEVDAPIIAALKTENAQPDTSKLDIHILLDVLSSALRQETLDPETCQTVENIVANYKPDFWTEFDTKGLYDCGHAQTVDDAERSRMARMIGNIIFNGSQSESLREQANEKLWELAPQIEALLSGTAKKVGA